MTANASPGKQAAGCDAKLDLTGSLCCGVEVIMTGSATAGQVFKFVVIIAGNTVTVIPGR